MTLEFAAARVGTFRGDLLVSATSDTLIESKRVPFKFEVRPRYRGLALSEDRLVELGTFPAGRGRTSATLRFPTEDSESANYVLTATDLSSGNHAIRLKLSADQVPTRKEAAGEVDAFVEIGNVAAGEYSATVIASIGAGEQRQAWQTRLRLVVTEPLVATELDLGELEPGETVAGRFTLRNVAEASVPDIELGEQARIKSKNQTTATELPAKASPNKFALDARGEKTVPVEITLPRDCSLRGKQTGHLVVTRGGVTAVHVPVRLTVIERGSRPAPFQAAPQKLSLKAGPREVVEFQLLIKADGRLKEPTTLTASLVELKPFANRRPTASDFEWPSKDILRPRESLELRGSLIVPAAIGTYAGEISVSSSQGEIRVPLVVEVRE